MENIYMPGEPSIPAVWSKAKHEESPALLLLPADPLMGADIHFSLMGSIHAACEKAGWHVLRAGYRNEPKFVRPRETWEDCMEEVADAAMHFAWLQENLPYNTPIWTCGYSFGAWVALQLAVRRPQVSGFVAVSPLLNHHDYSFLQPCPISGLFITGAEDEHLPQTAVHQNITPITKDRHTCVRHEEVAAADHYYRNTHDGLYRKVKAYLEEVRQNGGAPC